MMYGLLLLYPISRDAFATAAVATMAILLLMAVAVSVWEAVFLEALGDASEKLRVYLVSSLGALTIPVSLFWMRDDVSFILRLPISGHAASAIRGAVARDGALAAFNLFFLLASVGFGLAVLWWVTAFLRR
jgi:hypothetical protein